MREWIEMDITTNGAKIINVLPRMREWIEMSISQYLSGANEPFSLV